MRGILALGMLTATACSVTYRVVSRMLSPSWKTGLSASGMEPSMV